MSAFGKLTAGWLALTLAAANIPAAASLDDGSSTSAIAIDSDRPLSPAGLAVWHNLGFGMFIHWGLYSQLGGVWKGKPITAGYSEQIQSFARISTGDYADVAKTFRAQKFDADAICGAVRNAGARYIVVTSKHHDGFAMFDTASTDYNIVRRTPFGKDPLRLLSEACRKQGLGFGMYFSLVDWHAGHRFDPDNGNPIPASVEPLIEQQLRELMTNYGKIVEVWFDMSSASPEQSRRFAAIVRARQPEAAINGRIWNNVGDFVTLGDNEVPPPGIEPPFETPASIYHDTWGYRSWQRRDDAGAKVRELVRGLMQSHAHGGNYLLNIGPQGDGAIVPFEAQVLQGIGAWLRRHADAALNAEPTALPSQAWGETTQQGNDVFLLLDHWPTASITLSGLATDPVHITIDADAASPPLHWERSGRDLRIDLPVNSPDAVMPVLRVSLASPLRIIPAQLATVAGDRDTHVPRQQWTAGTSFGFRNGYNTQFTTQVVLSTHVSSTRTQRFLLRLDGAKAREEEMYRVALGAQVLNVRGSDLLHRAIGPLETGANETTRLSIRLANPGYAAEDLGLNFSDAVLVPQHE